MIKFLLYSTALLCLLTQAGCERTEAALSDETESVQTKAVKAETSPPAPSRLARETKAGITPVKTLAPPTKAPVKTAEVKPLAQHKPAVTPFHVKRCMNMGNALEAPNEGDWGYRIRAKDFRTIAAAGFDTVRIPIRWDAHTDRRPPYQIEPRFMARVKRVVSDAKAAGLGVIIDVHHYEDLMTHTNREEPRFLAIWDQIGRAFSNAGSKVYFEALNEPTLDITPERLNALYAKVVPVIRRTNPSRKIIIGGYSWNSVEALASVKWPKDANLVATFHDYGPHEFTHQGAEWMSPVKPMGRRWGRRADMADLKDTYKIAKAFKARTGLPILVGEFGVIDKVPQEERNQWIKSRRQTIEAAGYSWCAWDFSGAFKSYDTTTERWAPGLIAALVGQ